MEQLCRSELREDGLTKLMLYRHLLELVTLTSWKCHPDGRNVYRLIAARPESLSTISGDTSTASKSLPCTLAVS